MLENIYGFVSPALSAEELFMQGWCNLALEGSTGSLLAEDSNKGPTMAVQGACWCRFYLVYAANNIFYCFWGVLFVGFVWRPLSLVFGLCKRVGIPLMYTS